MAKRVKVVPNLPNITADVRSSVTQLNRQLYQDTVEQNYRLNLAIPKDGTEPMEAPLPLQPVPTASLPDATTNEGSVIYDTTTNELKYSDGVNWVAVQPAISGGTRTRLTGDLTIPVGSGQTFTTLQDAWNHVSTNLDLAGFDVTLDLDDGSYAAGLDDHAPGTTSIDEQIDGVFPVGGGIVKIVGNVSTPANVTIDNSIYGIRVAHSHVEIHGITFDSPSNAGICLVAAWEGQIVIGDGIVFGGADQHIHASSGGRVVLADSSAGYTITDGADFHFLCDSNGLVRVTDGAVTVSGTPGFNAFAVASDNGVVQTGGLTFSGSATGTRFAAAGGGVIDTGGTNNLSFFPGNAAGTVFDNGQYDAYYGGIDATFASGSFPAANNVDIPLLAGIKQIFISISGASSNTATRYPLVRISTDGGSTYLTTGYSSFGISATPALLTDDTGLLSAFQTAAAARSWTINGTIGGLTGGSGIFSSWNGVTDDFSLGVIWGSSFRPATTSVVTHIRITWNGTGNFEDRKSVV